MASLSNVTDVASAALWANVDGKPTEPKTLLGTLIGLLGSGATLRDIAFIPQGKWDTLIEGIKLGDPPAELSAVQLSQIAQFKYAAMQSAIPGHISGATPTTPGSSSAAPQVINMVSDRNTKRISDLFGSPDIVLVKLEKHVIANLYQEFRTARGDFPSRDVEPSEDQLSAVFLLIAGKHALYVDFALFTPYNSKFQDKIKYTSSRFDPIKQEWNKIELPGPRSIDEWNRSWAVFECCLLLLKTVPPETVQAYARLINRLANQYGHQCWFIVYHADVLMRSDHMDRIRRSAAADVIKTIDGVPFDKAKPWPQVFAIACSDIHPQATAFWTENVHHPAMRFTISSHTPRVGAQTAALQPPGKVPKITKPDVCREYIAGKCFGKQCPQGLTHPPCPHCGDFHAKLSCPSWTSQTGRGSSKGKGFGTPPPPPPPPGAGHTDGSNTKGKKGKGKGGKKGKGKGKR